MNRIAAGEVRVRQRRRQRLFRRLGRVAEVPVVAVFVAHVPGLRVERNDGVPVRRRRERHGQRHIVEHIRHAVKDEADARTRRRRAREGDRLGAGQVPFCIHRRTISDAAVRLAEVNRIRRRHGLLHRARKDMLAVRRNERPAVHVADGEPAEFRRPGVVRRRQRRTAQRTGVGLHAEVAVLRIAECRHGIDDRRERVPGGEVVGHADGRIGAGADCGPRVDHAAVDSDVVAEGMDVLLRTQIGTIDGGIAGDAGARRIRKRVVRKEASRKMPPVRQRTLDDLVADDPAPLEPDVVRQRIPCATAGYRAVGENRHVAAGLAPEGDVAVALRVGRDARIAVRERKALDDRIAAVHGDAADSGVAKAIVRRRVRLTPDERLPRARALVAYGVVVADAETVRKHVGGAAVVVAHRRPAFAVVACGGMDNGIRRIGLLDRIV